MTFSNQSRFQKVLATKGWRWFPAVSENPEAPPILRGGADDNPAHGWSHLVKWLRYKAYVVKSYDRLCPLSFSWACFLPSVRDSKQLVKTGPHLPAGNVRNILEQTHFYTRLFLHFEFRLLSEGLFCFCPRVTRTTGCQGRKVPW